MLLHRRPTHDGFSLLELIVSLAIVGLVASAVGGFLLAWQVRTFSNYTEVQLYNDFRYALNLIAYYARKASSIVKGYDGSYTLTFPDQTRLLVGRHVYRRTLWVKTKSSPICSHVAEFEIDTAALPLITIRITSVAHIPGINRGLPLIMSKQVRMRNYGK